MADQAHFLAAAAAADDDDDDGCDGSRHIGIDTFQWMTIFLSLTIVNDIFFKVLSINFCH